MDIISTYEGLHPILVHFPIALLSLYAILELVRFNKLTQWPSYFYIKAFLAIVGFAAAILAFMAGPDGPDIHSWSGYAGMVSSNGQPLVRQIVDMHSNFAAVTLIIFGIIAVSYLVSWIERQYHFGHKAWKTLVRIVDFIHKPAPIIILALFGLFTITVTGALGGSIVYGPDIDPAVSFIYHWFF